MGGFRVNEDLEDPPLVGVNFGQENLLRSLGANSGQLPFLPSLSVRGCLPFSARFP